MSIEGLYSAWQVLNDLLGELRERDVFIPNMTYADLRNSKMVLEYLRSFEDDIQPSDPDQRLRAEMEIKMHSLRETLMVWSEEREGVDYRQSWEERFNKALHEETRATTEEHKVPISDIPRERGVGFFRIRLPEEIPVEVVSEIAEDCGVLISLDGERHLQVSGNRDCIRDAMKKLGELFYGESKLA
ncbi:MAG: DUF2096 family protein [Candidatus Thorarchaeota archaeon]